MQVAIFSFCRCLNRFQNRNCMLRAILPSTLIWLIRHAICFAMLRITFSVLQSITLFELFLCNCRPILLKLLLFLSNSDFD